MCILRRRKNFMVSKSLGLWHTLYLCLQATCFANFFPCLFDTQFDVTRIYLVGCRQGRLLVADFCRLALIFSSLFPPCSSLLPLYILSTFMGNNQIISARSLIMLDSLSSTWPTAMEHSRWREALAFCSIFYACRVLMFRHI